MSDSAIEVKADACAGRDLPTYRIDCRRMKDRDGVYGHLLSVLPLPDWCGRNLDALADALWELPPCRIVMVHARLLGADGLLGDYGSDLLQVLTDFATTTTDVDLAIYR